MNERYENFMLKETITGILDVIYDNKIGNETEMVLKVELIPNEVNGSF